MNRDVVYILEVESVGETFRAVRSYKTNVAAKEIARETRIGYKVLRTYQPPKKYSEAVFGECAQFVEGKIKDIETLDARVEKIMGR